MTHENGQAVVFVGGFGSVGSDDGDSVSDAGIDVRNFEELPVREVLVDTLSPGPYLRQGGTDAAHVQLLVDAAGSSELPPILVQDAGCRVIDGMHRLQAAKLRGEGVIKARFVDCSDAEALVLAMTANSSHGLPLSRADRVSGAKQVLSSHPDWSDRAIAGITGLSAKTIASLRSRLAGGADLGNKRLGRDGRRRPVSAGEGRRRAAEYLGAHPNAPLRQVARETDVSLGTVHDVSARLRRGINPQRTSNDDPTPQLTTTPTDDHHTDTPTTAAFGAGHTPLRRTNHTEPPPTWAGISAKMAKDPTIRYSEGGKEFLRWMALHASDPDGWRKFLNAIPAHWLSIIAPIADNISKEWALFAEQLKHADNNAIGA
ncbi:nuclease [Actinobacteria bacterium YIM 96077]|uniref:Nuclease n=1 Tax=Phytoactinopolyspora halophila TaxID=1981511 RepID=A0A329QA12_9ACTN|nr:ParB N-terminal domain-containing protein [Phytoactinopolyspora halophila]AYY12623.1 nuclease [Actinobacteria bacterium YIM 96077]AYY12627.1 nuclease [Actinobacteria bacterium YIM 96077]RAW09153.1 nuclease [Phytoactinopolyspora halophila]